MRRIGIAAFTSFGLMTASVFAAEPVTIGTGVDASFSPVFVALQNKLFEKEGLNVTTQNYPSGGEATDAVGAGQLNMTVVGAPAALNRGSRVDVRILAIVETHGKFVKLVARKGITDPSQIKKIGFAPAGDSEYSVRLAMKKYNIPNVELVRSAPPELPALLTRGDIDAFFIWEPWPSLAVKQGGSVLAVSEDVGHLGTIVLVTSADWLKQHRAAAEGVARALAQACDAIRANPEEAGKAAQMAGKIPVDQTVQFVKEVDCKVRSVTDKDLEDYDRIADFLLEQKITKTKTDLSKVVVKDFYKP
ncbi:MULTISPECIES: ABC transporter substrate-binding protein [unclassified Chelatococcus]|uniref:ABC transporter substrate-binding protein n=1 Tax=unclassified Chelatococcus TaxID=2638111 RepID=UPI001BCF44EF|nr:MULTISPECIES: ABC transporter substrate-binding protein [unclassified Chelatococcus]MBS7741906.1 ABC transporter substrate-binding protein [Chelatococcus sp. HY11]MBX3541296.1 ABC transporter substrate-binding protein [Chelatococcus sp.]MCO5074811.1 ABC transporter substrate-binding protein [Chelatococcus sp.]